MSSVFDAFKPYSERIHGDLREYLLQREEGGADNLFHGSLDFMLLREKGFLVPGSVIRVNRSPVPDMVYTIDDALRLTSHGAGTYNMSAMSAPSGEYDPTTLDGTTWSAYNLHFPPAEHE